MLDRDMLFACNKLLEKQEQEHLMALGLDQEETLSDIDKIVSDIITDVQSRRAIS